MQLQSCVSSGVLMSGRAEMCHPDHSVESRSMQPLKVWKNERKGKKTICFKGGSCVVTLFNVL